MGPKSKIAKIWQVGFALSSRIQFWHFFAIFKPYGDWCEKKQKKPQKSTNLQAETYFRFRTFAVIWSKYEVILAPNHAKAAAIYKEPRLLGRRFRRPFLADSKAEAKSAKFAPP